MYLEQIEGHNARLEALKAKVDELPEAGGGDSSGGITEELPSGYARVEYIQSTGTQWIDTEVAGKSDIEVYIDFEYTALSGTQVIFGSYGGNVRFYPLSSLGYFGYGSSYYTITETLTAETPYEMYAKLAAGEQILTLNGITAHSGTAVARDSGINMYLFAANHDGTADYLSKIKLRRCRILQDGALVRYFLPCVNAENEAGLYDLVSCRFFTNGGTGAFEAVRSYLPELTNPAAAAQVLNGYEFIDPETGEAGTGTLGADITNPAAAGNVQSGYQILNAAGETVTGTMTRYYYQTGSKTFTTTGDQSFTVTASGSTVDFALVYNTEYGEIGATGASISSSTSDAAKPVISGRQVTFTVGIDTKYRGGRYLIVSH